MTEEGRRNRKGKTRTTKPVEKRVPPSGQLDVSLRGFPGFYDEAATRVILAIATL